MGMVSVNPNARTLLGTRVPAVVETLDVYKGRIEAKKFGTIRKLPLESPLIQRGVESIFLSIRGGKGAPKKSTRFMGMLQKQLKDKDCPMRGIENICKIYLESVVMENRWETLNSALAARPGILFRHVGPFVRGDSVLDLGAGDGWVGEMIAEKMGLEVTLADVVNQNDSRLPVDIYDGIGLPYPDRAFDTTMLLMVLENADEPLKVLEEAIRVTKKRLIIIESIYFNEEHMVLSTFLHWFHNRVIYTGINCPFNFQSQSGWEDTFRHYALYIAESRDLGIGLEVVPKYHWRYVLDVDRMKVSKGGGWVNQEGGRTPAPSSGARPEQ